MKRRSVRLEGKSLASAHPFKETGHKENLGVT